MNHPSPEQWMAYLYRESTREDKAQLKAHLSHCPECRQRVGTWQATVNGLDQWKPTGSPPQRVVPFNSPALKWAMAALFVLGLGFGIGRLSAPRPDLDALRAALEPSLRRSLARDVSAQVQEQFRADWLAAVSGKSESLNTPFRRELHSGLDQITGTAAAESRRENNRLWSSFLDSYSTQQRDDRQATVTLLRQLEDKRQAEMFSMRRALETVAVVAADKFQRTDSELGQLASAQGSPEPLNQPTSNH